MLLQALLATLAPAPLAPSEGSEVAFRDREIYAFSNGLLGLMHGDWDGDGVLDLAAVNRARARVEVLVRLAPGAPDRPFVDPEADSDEARNAIRYDGRYRRVDHPFERRVWRAAAGDLDADGRDEIVLASERGRVSVVGLDPADGDDAEPKLLARRDVDGLRRETRWLSVADVDGDGRGDLLALGDGELFAIPVLTADDGSIALGPEEVLDYPGDPVDGAHLVDLDGDGARDLLTVHYERDHPFRYRLRQPDGRFGPRTDLDLPPVRGHALGDVDGDGADEIACILQVSGRVAWLEPGPPEHPPLLRHSLGNPTDDAERSYAVADLDGDGTDDVVVADAGASRVVVLLGQPTGAPVRRSFPSLAGVASPRAGDVDGDGRTDLLVVAGPERMIGTSELDADGELGFPDARAAEGEPVAGDLHDLDGDGFDDAVVLSTTGEGRRREYRLGVWAGGPDGLAREARTVALEGFDQVPSALRVGDLDRDGLADFLFYPPTSNDFPKVFYGGPEGPVADDRGEDAPGMGILKGAGPGRLELGDHDGDGADDLLATTPTFARALWLEREGPEQARWLPQVLGQWSAPASDARLEGATSADLDGDGRPELVLRDGASKEVLVLDAASGEVRARFDAGRIDFRRFGHGDLDGDGRQEVIVFGAHQVGVVGGSPGSDAARPPGPGLRELASYEGEPPRFPYRLATADFDRDGRAEVAAIELVHHGVRLLELRTEPGGDLVSGPVFRVFEEKTFAGASNAREPRELTCADLTGDGRADIAVLVHDKLIVYPQK